MHSPCVLIDRSSDPAMAPNKRGVLPEGGRQQNGAAQDDDGALQHLQPNWRLP